MSGKNKKSKNKRSSSNSQVKPEALAKQTKQAVQDVPAKQTITKSASKRLTASRKQMANPNPISSQNQPAK